MTAVMPGSQNTFIPNHEATGKLVVDFARNINSFPVNRYSQIVPVKQTKGYYLNMTVEQAGRIQYNDGRNFVWPDGSQAPEGNQEAETFEYRPYETVRRAFPVMLGDLTIDQASWDILAQNSSIKARQAMTLRTQLAITQATTVGNWDASHVLDVTDSSDVPGTSGMWTESTTARQDIRRSLNQAADIIIQDTLAAVDVNDLIVVIGLQLAKQLAQTQEIVDYIKGTPDALAEIRGEKPGRNAIFGLPEKLYGFPVVVENTVKVTSRRGAAAVRQYVLPAATPFMVARPGGLVGVADAPSFSTLTCFAHEEMTVETKRDTDNRRTQARVVENYEYKLIASAAGVLFQNAA